MSLVTNIVAPLLCPNAATCSSSPATICRLRLTTVAPAARHHSHPRLFFIAPPAPLLRRATITTGATHAAISSDAFCHVNPSLLSGELLLSFFSLDEHIPCHPLVRCFASELYGSSCGLFPVSVLQ
jgi:hypothetical protein